jgi:hypothetical protein
LKGIACLKKKKAALQQEQCSSIEKERVGREGKGGEIDEEKHAPAAQRE